MNRRRMAIVLGALAAVASLGVYISSRNVSPDEAQQLAAAASKDGIVNPEQSATAMKTLPMPRLSDARFEPPPTITTGTYTDPEHRKPADSKDKSSPR
jgi:hypothetical protein